MAPIKGSLRLAAVVLLFDIGFDGFYMLSIEVCPIWFLISFVKNAIQRPGWGISVLRVSLPLVTLAIAMSNAGLQWNISNLNAERVIIACEESRLDNGSYPTKLEELVPRYLPFVPRAKYCLTGFFMYHDSAHGSCILEWPRYGFYRRFYDFNEMHWSNLD